MKGDEEGLLMEDFIAFFDVVPLPYSFSDTLLSKKGNDSMLISPKVFDQFLGDTLLKQLHGNEKPKIYAVGAFFNEDKETYLLYRTAGKQQGIYITTLNDKQAPVGHLLLMATKGKPKEINKVVIDTRFTLSLADEYKNSDGSRGVYTSVYAYNNAGFFMEIMNDGLKKGEELPIINPIDSFPATRLYSGDYGEGTRNFISVRDGKTPKTFVFFMNMDKSNDCTAEIKGEATWVKKDSAIFEAKDDPCKLGFKFSSSRIVISEAGTCGSKRPGGCSFNASYRKKATPRKPANKTK